MTSPSHHVIRNRLLWVLGSAAGLLAALVGLMWWRKRTRPRPEEAPPADTTFDLPGLSQAQAEARYRAGQSNAIHLRPAKTLPDRFREYALSVFNIGLVAIIFVQILLGKYFDALISFGVMLFTIGVNVFQDAFARMRLRAVQEAAQPLAVVIRDGKPRSIHPDEIVVGDMVEFRAGDQIMVDGVLKQGVNVIMDETLTFGATRSMVKKPGDAIYAGSLCVTGRGVMETTAIDQDRQIIRRLQGAPLGQESMTPIERLIDRILKWLLAFVLAIAAFLLAKFFLYDEVLPQETVNKFIDAIGVIFSIAPAGLFFMISLTYAASTVDLARLHVLVHRARAIETLAQIDLLFLHKTGFILRRWIEMTPIKHPPLEGSKPPSEMTIRRMLGTFARSISHQNQFTRTMQAAFEGLKLPPAEEMPFYSHYGWSGIRIESESMQGVLVLGEPERLAPFLVSEPTASAEAPGKRLTQTFARFRSLFRGSGKHAPARPATSEPHQEEPAPPEASGRQGFFGKTLGKVTRVLRRAPETEAGEPPIEETAPHGASLLFAWSPEPRPLVDADGNPKPPEGLIPLCQLSLQDRADPEAVRALRSFASHGVASKIIDEGPVEGIRDALRRAGADQDLVASFRGISAKTLQGLSDEALAAAIIRHHLIGEADASFMSRAVKALRHTDHLVGVLGAEAGELDAMMASDLGITLITAPSGVLNLAEIILMDISPRVISTMIDKGQRIVNGLLDVLKLYLTQAFYLLLLVGSLLFFLRSFPYRGAQGGLIAAFALSIPALALTLTAQPGRLQVKNVSLSLFSFVIPAGVSIALTGFLLFAHFLARYHDQPYAQIALVHALVAMGLLLAILLRPPLKLRRSVIPITFQYFLPTLVALISGAVFLTTTFIPLAQKLLYVTPLKSARDYMLVGSASLAWAVAFGAYWFIVTVLAYRLRATRALARRDG